MGKCESSLHFNEEMRKREKELKCYFENKINNLISKNKELSSQSNAYAMEVSFWVFSKYLLFLNALYFVPVGNCNKNTIGS